MINGRKVTVFSPDGEQFTANCEEVIMEHPGWLRITIRSDSYGASNMVKWVNLTEGCGAVVEDR